MRSRLTALPYALIFAAAAAVPLVRDDYLVLIATRAAVYWVLVSGLNLVVGFAGQLAIGWVSLLTIGAYTTSIIVARGWLGALPALGVAGVAGARGGVLVGLPALRLRTFYFAMTTLGFATIVTQVALAWTRRDWRGDRYRRPNPAGAARHPDGLLLLLPRPCRALHLDDAQYRREPIWPRARRIARRRSGGRGHGYLQDASASDGVPIQRRASRAAGARP